MLLNVFKFSYMSSVGRWQDLVSKPLTVVRDQIRVVDRLSSRGKTLLSTPCEMDIEVMFWQIRADEAQKALEWAIKKMKRNKQSSWFVVHRAGVKKLDRLGERGCQ